MGSNAPAPFRWERDVGSFDKRGLHRWNSEVPRDRRPVPSSVDRRRMRAKWLPTVDPISTITRCNGGSKDAGAPTRAARLTAPYEKS